MPQLELDREIAPSLLAEIREKLPFVSRVIEEVAVRPESPRLLWFRVRHPREQRAARRQLESLVAEICRDHRDLPAERIFEHRAAGGTERTDPVPALQARGELALLGPGQVGLSGWPLRLCRYFDAVARGWAVELGAREHQFPSVIPLRTLARAGYPQSFPHHLTLATHVKEGLESLRRFAADPERPRARDLSAPEHVLAPAVCYHWYPMWQERSLEGPATVMTAQGRCFRYEAAHLAPLERLWDFTMREIVVLGTAAEVEAVRRDLIRKASQLVVDLDLDGHIETANDPFFTRESQGKRLLQRLQALKYELRLTLDGGGRTCAVASFNHHRDYFGRCFEIRLASGAPAHSGCMAFGLERWALAFLSRYGLDDARWPRAVRSGCGSGAEERAHVP